MIFRNFIISALLVSLCPCILVGQNFENERMLLYEVEGNEYVKKDFSRDSSMTGKQVLKVGAVEKENNLLKMPVQLYSYDEKGELTDSTKTVYLCDPDERRVLVNLFPYSDYTTESEIKVNLLDTNAFYPVDPDANWEMESIEFEMNIDKGVIGFLGGKSRIKMYNRQVVPNDTLEADQYEINSQVELGVYALGIKMKGLNYQVTEVIDRNKGLIYQKFTSEDGSYFIIRSV